MSTRVTGSKTKSGGRPSLSVNPSVATTTTLQKNAVEQMLLEQTLTGLEQQRRRSLHVISEREKEMFQQLQRCGSISLDSIHTPQGTTRPPASPFTPRPSVTLTPCRPSIKAVQFEEMSGQCVRASLHADDTGGRHMGSPSKTPGRRGSTAHAGKMFEESRSRGRCLLDRQNVRRMSKLAQERNTVSFISTSKNVSEEKRGYASRGVGGEWTRQDAGKCAVLQTYTDFRSRSKTDTNICLPRQKKDEEAACPRTDTHPTQTENMKIAKVKLGNFPLHTDFRSGSNQSLISHGEVKALQAVVSSIEPLPKQVLIGLPLNPVPSGAAATSSSSSSSLLHKARTDSDSACLCQPPSLSQLSVPGPEAVTSSGSGSTRRRARSASVSLDGLLYTPATHSMNTQERWENLGVYLGELRREHSRIQSAASRGKPALTLSNDNQSQPQISPDSQSKLLPRRHSEGNVLLWANSLRQGLDQESRTRSNRMKMAVCSSGHPCDFVGHEKRKTSVTRLASVHRILQSSALAMADMDQDTF